RQVRELVAPLEPFGAAGQKQKLRHPLLLQLDQSLPGQLDLVLPEPAFAFPALAGNSRGLPFALDPDLDRARAGRFHLLRPEPTLFERALAAVVAAERVYIQYPQEGMADEQSGQVVG